ncbi:D-alanyl-lipoteichoic acid biosynthesis protein DltD [Bacillus sp. MUM 116]|uniref:D-alanyl-lipoteichoic acid biosynthesis protein DltD n=1 Tax=Bacillus sp. MUM 116 TaxID=1678002 RepID=UPI0008F5B42B|nr:D-alanyl-lipoteichoic acid biosynthesis protein DltD [Bacillus sp. MUM 116]OIK15615.1 D-alanyl-lipoteichoic acid biosynthesis protein DltD [Bacillus sp. MUM 116]
MKKPIFMPLILAFIVLIVLVIIPNKWIESLIPKNRISEAATQLNPFMFQGKYVQGIMLEDPKYLPIYGSSELARLDRFHPSNYFQVANDGFTPFLVGRGGSESLIHFLNFSEHLGELKGKKIVFVLSPQWFNPNGADESHFVPNYSSLQGYDFAFNNTLNPEVKKKAIKRLLTYSSVKDDPMLSTLYKSEISNNPWTKEEATLVRPFALAYRSLLEKKDLYYTFAGGTKRGRDISPTLRHKTWHQLELEAEQYGAVRATNNHFYIVNSQYNNIKSFLPSLKNKNIHGSYGKSKEYGDFQLVLDVLKQAGAKPLFISVPVNGHYYDYTGFPKKGRTDYYHRIKKQIEAEGFQVADFSGHEYDPYFMKDTIHIGWKGWVYTDRAIKQFYNGNDKKLVRLN